ncbi:uncharacterized protein EAE97_004835 [Botrytis byssoidea]|uniref:Uncharacterized protein n=1 Tax=Botrytis byssoidea TaxID=139641 RepID=A0A9P5IQ06_9HELO|nr:uncharacterized protein EAE97_004835 [Botrytis byssoidea]KAF7945797.1 hypothetical protein EAE97_004835 [Botrytis byssoidea]
MQVPQEETFQCSRRHIQKKVEAYTDYCIRGCPEYCGCYRHTSESGRKTQKLARRERIVSEMEIKVTREKDRLADRSTFLEHWNNMISLRSAVVSSREALLEKAKEEFERKKNELLAPKSWFEEIAEWSENTSQCAQDGSSYGSYGSKPRSNSNGSLQPTRALDSGERPRHRRSFHGDRPTQPHEEPSRARRSSSASYHHRQDSNQPAIRITPPGIYANSIPNDWGNNYEY